MNTMSDHEFTIDPNQFVSALHLAELANEAASIVPCVNDPELWFPEKGDSVNAARNLCLTECPIVLQCRAHALEHHETTGIWGGFTLLERRAVWKKRHAEKKNRMS